MTALITSQIPSSINTLEKLFLWSAYSLAYINQQTQLFETETDQVIAAQVNIYPVNSPQNSVAGAAIVREYRAIVRFGLAIDKEHLTGDLPPWMYAKDLSNTVLPATFSS
jgi:hypothetical protein